MFLHCNCNTVYNCGPVKHEKHHWDVVSGSTDPLLSRVRTRSLCGASHLRARLQTPLSAPWGCDWHRLLPAFSCAHAPLTARSTAHAPPLILLTHVLHRRIGSPFLLQSGCWTRACALPHFLSCCSQWGGALPARSLPPNPPPLGRRRPPGAAQRQDGGGRRRGGAGLGGGGAAAALCLLLGLRDERAPSASRLRYREVRTAAAGWAPGLASLQAVCGPEVFWLGCVGPRLGAVCGVGSLGVRKALGLQRVELRGVCATGS